MAADVVVVAVPDAASLPGSPGDSGAPAGAVPAGRGVSGTAPVAPALLFIARCTEVPRPPLAAAGVEGRAG
ncbi:hypothetical protein [Streptomyces sp. NPDC056683]|uniref:hypothetical protein n=1 Tax=Streptomyces sp. NPDC056683 TaxID=3345910 RepID=UPI00369ED68A